MELSSEEVVTISGELSEVLSYLERQMWNHRAWYPTMQVTIKLTTTAGLVS